MLFDWRMVQLYDEYARYGEASADFRALLVFLQRRAPEEQAAYLDAALRPGEYLWPNDADTTTYSGMTDFFRTIGSVPIKRKKFDAINAAYVLPYELSAMMTSCASYHDGMEILAHWAARGQLFPKTSSREDDDARAAMSVNLYDKKSRLQILGHTSAILGQAQRVAGELSRLPFAENGDFAPVIAPAVARAKEIPERKVTRADVEFLSKVSDLFNTRGDIRRRRWKRYPAFGAAAGLLTFLLHFFAGRAGDLIMKSALAVFAAGSLIFYARSLRRERVFRRQYPYMDVFFGYFTFAAGVAVYSFDSIMAGYQYVFSFIAGAIPATAVPALLDTRAMSRSAKLILDACQAYNDAGNVSRE
jgi:hypothetical protein